LVLKTVLSILCILNAAFMSVKQNYGNVLFLH
jgi:hypothetical protein